MPSFGIALSMAKKIATKNKNHPGVFYSESTARKYNGKPDRIYWIAYRDPDLKWLKVGRASEGVTEAYAFQKRVEILNNLNLGENPAALIRKKTPVLDSIAGAYFEWMKVEGKSAGREKNRYDVHIKPVLGTTNLNAITPERLDAFKAELSATLAPATVQKIFSMLRAAVNLALRRKKITGINPFSRQGNFIMPKVDNGAERFLTVQEADDLLKELELRSAQLCHMAFVALHTGLRATELFEIKGADIDANNKIANIRAKGGNRETVFLEPEVLEILQAYYTTPDARLFPDRNGQRMKGIPKTFDRAVEVLGLNQNATSAKQKVIFHTLRHTFASWLAQSGKTSLLELQKLMRHKKIEMTLRYAHLFPGQQREKLPIINQILTVHRLSLELHDAS
jgi:integrase